jgi:hypothetical protein
MPSRGQPLLLSYTAWDVAANLGKAGDAGNHSLVWIKDGVAATPANAGSIYEPNAATAKGEYVVSLTANECNCNFGKLSGVSATTGVTIIPVPIAFENLPTQSPGSVNGVAVLDANSAVPANVQRWLGQAAAAVRTSGVPIVDVGYTAIALGVDGTLAAASPTTVTFPSTDARGNLIADDSRYAYTLIRTMTSPGGGQVIGLAGKSGTRTFDVAFGMNVQCGTGTQYELLGSWRAQVQNAVQLDLAQSVPTSNANQTVGDALNMALADAAGKWSLDRLTRQLTLYARDGVTVVRVFTIDDVNAPSQRT